MKSREELRKNFDEDLLFFVEVKTKDLSINKKDLTFDQFYDVLESIVESKNEVIQYHLNSNIGYGGYSSNKSSIYTSCYRKRIEGFENHRCPRREESPFPNAFISEGKNENNPDTWDLIGKDRVCSYCGSLHPEDLNALIKIDKSVIEGSTKDYKLYFNRKGINNAGQGAIKFYKQHWNTKEGSVFFDELQNILKNT